MAYLTRRECIRHLNMTYWKGQLYNLGIAAGIVGVLGGARALAYHISTDNPSAVIAKGIVTASLEPAMYSFMIGAALLTMLHAIKLCASLTYDLSEKMSFLDGLFHFGIAPAPIAVPLFLAMTSTSNVSPFIAASAFAIISFGTALIDYCSGQNYTSSVTHQQEGRSRILSGHGQSPSQSGYTSDMKQQELATAQQQEQIERKWGPLAEFYGWDGDMPDTLRLQQPGGPAFHR